MLAVGAAAVCVSALLAGRGADLEAFAAWTQGFGPWAPLVFAGGYAVATVAMVPGSILTLAAGALFGLSRGVGAAFTGAVLGSALSFLLARYLARGLVESRIASNPKFTAIDRGLGREGLKIAFLLRLSPVFPFNVLNYALGITRISFPHYLLASAGMLPATVLYVYYGKVAGDLARVAGDAGVERGPGYWAVLALGLLATVAAATLAARAAKRALADSTELDQTTATAGGAAGHTGSTATATPVGPADRWNLSLLNDVGPSDWQNPNPQASYQLVVIGGGPAGLVAAVGAAGLGARVALVEKRLLGGDCLNFGCVPSKALLRAAKAWQQGRRGQDFGAPGPTGAGGDFAVAMERLRRLRSELGPADSAQRLKDLGIDVFFGAAVFTAADSLSVGDTQLRFGRALIATGARPACLPIDGLEEAGYLTNETVFSLQEKPQHLAVIGAGPVGCELAQAFARFGCKVSMIDKGQRMLPADDPDAAGVVQEALTRDGVDYYGGAVLKRVAAVAGQTRIDFVDAAGHDVQLQVDRILVAAGRSPNTEGLGLEQAGVACSSHGITVDDNLRTSNKRIFACGDVASAYKFTHAADAQARIVIQNALFMGRAKASRLVVPWCTYTSPELAHVGINDSQAKALGNAVQSVTVAMAEVDRARLDGNMEGFVRLHVKRSSGKLLGATLVSEHAGETIAELTLAMTAGIGLGKLGSTIHAYPTESEVVRKAADQWRRLKLTPRTRKALSLYFKLRNN